MVDSAALLFYASDIRVCDIHLVRFLLVILVFLFNFSHYLGKYCFIYELLVYLMYMYFILGYI